MSGLYERLEEYSGSDYYPFHMPGHKRRSLSELEPYRYDITEIDGFDNLHEPEGILRIAMDEAAELYGTKKTYFMVNGSSGGILAAISAVTDNNDKILVARNCHRSVYNAIYLKQLYPVYIYPEYIQDMGINGGINVSDVERELKENKDIKAVVITSPTYEGVVSDVRAIADVAHRHGAVLIVDEAHGAHFSMNERLPASANQRGADIVIQSMLKTLPALTQTALLHVNGDRVDIGNVEKYLHIYQTSSPSYVLMASMDKCLDMLKRDGNAMFEAYVRRMLAIQSHCRKLTHIKVLNSDIKGRNSVYDFDISKLVISVKGTGYTGQMLYKKLLDEYKLQMEMASGDYVIAMTSVMDTEEGLLRLFSALAEIDRDIRVYGKKSLFVNNDEFKTEKAVVINTFWETERMQQERIRLSDASGKISGEWIYLYPPGIPIVAPGEMITGEIIQLIRRYTESGLVVRGMQDRSAAYVNVLKEEFKTWKFAGL